MPGFVLSVTQNSVDITSSISADGVSIVAKAGAARTCAYTYLLGTGAVDLTALVGVPVVVTVNKDAAGAETIFSGTVSRSPVYDLATRTISIYATDGWQEHLDGQTQTQLETAITGGEWNEDLDGTRTSGLSQAITINSCVAQDMFLDRDGDFTLASWTPKAAGSEDGTVDEDDVRDVTPALVNADELINTMVVTYKHTWTRRVWNRVYFSWTFTTGSPWTQWCDWYQHHGNDLPTKDEFESVAAGTGWLVIGKVSMTGHPASFGPGSPNGEPCGADIGFVNTIYPEIREVINASWYGGQTFTVEARETLTLTLTAASSVSAYGSHTGEATHQVQTEYADEAVEADDNPAQPSGFTAYGAGSNQSYSEEVDATQRSTAMELALKRGRVKILDTHRQNTVTWTMVVDPTCDLGQTWTIDHPLADCRGVVTDLQHTITLETALTQVTISAYLGGGGSDDSLTAPAVTVQAPTESAPANTTIGNKWGGLETSPAYDSAWEEGSYWIGNAHAPLEDLDSDNDYDVGLYVAGPDVSDTAREAVELTGSDSFAVEIPATTISITGG